MNGSPTRSSGTNGSGGAIWKAGKPAVLAGRGRDELGEVREQGRPVAARRTSGRRRCLRHRVQPEGELGHDAEVAAAAAQRPEQVRVLGLAGGHDLPVRGHDLGGDQVVAGQAVAAGQIADAAAEREPADAGRGDDAAGGRETVGRGRLVEDRPRDAAAGPRGPVRGVDGRPGQAGQVGDEGAVGGAETGHAVPAARTASQAGLGRLRTTAADVGRARTSHDGRRASVDHGVVDLPGLVVVGAPRGRSPGR